MEQTILEVIQNRERKMRQESLPNLQQKSNEITTSYGSRERFLATFNPDTQRDICGNAELCFFGGAPTLAQLNATYGDKTAAMWLVPQLYNLSEYCGCKDKLKDNPLKECASVIATEFYFLSVSELMLFFFRFKSGKYGRFYGSVDPLVITTSLRDFLKERSNAYYERDKAEKEKADREAAKNAESWEDYCMRQYGEIRPHPMRRQLDQPMKKPKPKEDTLAVFKMAKWLTAETIESVKETYGRIFKKKHGCSPEEYIKQHPNIEDDGNRQDSESRRSDGNKRNWGGQN